MRYLFHDIENIISNHPKREYLLLNGWTLEDEDGHSEGIHMDQGTPASDLQELLADPDVAKVSWSLWDPRYYTLCGYEVSGPIIDGMVMAYRLNENTPLDLEWCAKRYSDITMDKRLKRGAGRIWFVDDDEKQYDTAESAEWPPDRWMRFRAYCERDVATLRTLFHDLRDRLEESEWLDYWWSEDVPISGTLLRMMGRGLPVNLREAAGLAEEIRTERVRIEARLRQDAGLPDEFNMNSGDQLCAYLFSRVFRLKATLRWAAEEVDCLKSCLDGEHEDCELGGDISGFVDDDYDYGRHIKDLLPDRFEVTKVGRDIIHGDYVLKGRGLAATDPPKDPKTDKVGKRPSTASPELLYKHAADPWVRGLCLEYRKLDKLLTTYLDKFPIIAEGGRLYGRFNQTGTVTGRLSSNSPNLQNMPARGELGKKVRHLFQGNLVVGDYDQLEMRLMAHLSKDRRLVDIFRAGEDPHLHLARAIFGRQVEAEDPERDIGKTLNYAMGYGAGPRKIAQTLSLLGHPTARETAKGYLAEMAGFYSGLFRWKAHVIERAKRTGSVRTMGGRRRRLRATFKDVGNWKLVGYGERQAVNSFVQGSAADVVERVMVVVEREFPEFALLAQVHDELVWEHEPEVYDQGALDRLQLACESEHRFHLDVPLGFEPHYCSDWGQKKTGGIDFDEVFSEVLDDGE